MKYEAFISYRRRGGGALASEIYKALTNNGISTFYDRKELKFVDFRRQLISNNLQSSVLIVILSPDALNPERCRMRNDWVKREIELFLKLKKKIIFVKYKNFEFPDEKQLPKSLRKIKKLLNNKKNVVEYNGNDKKTIERILNIITERIPFAVKGQLIDIKERNSLSLSLSDRYLDIRREYRKTSIYNFLSEIIYLVIFTAGAIAIYNWDKNSFITFRLLTLFISIFIIFCKKNKATMIFFEDGFLTGLAFFISSIIKGLIVCVAIFLVLGILGSLMMKHPEIEAVIASDLFGRILIFPLGFVTSITVLIAIHESIMSIFHIINAYIGFSFTKMLARKYIINIFPDKIISNSAGNRNGVIIQLVFSAIAIAIEAYLCFNYSGYLT